MTLGIAKFIMANAISGWRQVGQRAGLAVTGLALGTHAASAQTPMYYLETFGPKGEITASLTWGLLAISVFVVVLISVLVLVAIFRAKRLEPAELGSKLPVSHPGGGHRWIYLGLALTTVALIVMVVWTMEVLAEIDEPAVEPAFTIEVTGEQWWWEARYVDPDDPSRTFVTANELHIPVGEPVRIRLASADVIHSFWVPALAGKTDVIPGQINETWLQADREGVYRGQCAEYCGVQHAHMAMRVFADPAEEFQSWWEHQLEPAEAAPQNSELLQVGQEQFVLKCGACHAVRGTLAGGEAGPDLTHFMDRTTIAAVTLPNTPGHLSGWIADPQHQKPGNKMPNLDLSGPELNAIRHYLETLD